MFVSFLSKCLSAVLVTVLSLPVLAGELRIVSYNIKHGEGMDGKLNLERTAEVLKKLNADVITLQEVDKNCARSGGVDQAAFLAEKLGMHHFFAKAINLGEGEYGNAVLSKLPIEQTKLHQLPGGGEKRVVAEVQVKGDAGLISVCSVHLDHKGEQVRVEQIKEIERFTSEYKHPVIMTGDFNARPDSEVLKHLQEKWLLVKKEGNGSTFPAPAPKTEIDYCVIRNLKLKSSSSKVVEEPMASDHRPLLTIVKW